MGDDIYVVTGGAGFIGSNIVALLLDAGKRVRVLDNFSTGRRENLERFSDRIELIEGDVRDFGTVTQSVAGCAFVSHQAALPSVVRSIHDPLTTHRVNVDGTLNLLLASRDAGVRRVVYASSSSVYGDSPSLPKHEEMAPRPLSPYAVGKLAGEYYCMVFSRLYGLSCVALRYFNVFGPRQDPRSQYAAVIPAFFDAICGNRELVIDGDGQQSRDFTFVENVARANLLACETALSGGEVMNIACGEATSINELLRLMQEVLGVSAKSRCGKPRPGDVRHSVADITKAREKLGFTPSVDLKVGLRRTAAYYRERCAGVEPA